VGWLKGLIKVGFEQQFEGSKKKLWCRCNKGRHATLKMKKKILLRKKLKNPPVTWWVGELCN